MPRLLESGGPHDVVCFHAQQAAEKSLKALLALRDAEIPRTHDLSELADLVEQSYPGAEIDSRIGDLTAFAVELRYDFEFWPDVETARRAVLVATETRAVAERLVG